MAPSQNSKHQNAYCKQVLSYETWESNNDLGSWLVAEDEDDDEEEEVEEEESTVWIPWGYVVISSLISLQL